MKTIFHHNCNYKRCEKPSSYLRSLCELSEHKKNNFKSDCGKNERRESERQKRKKIVCIVFLYRKKSFFFSNRINVS